MSKKINTTITDALTGEKIKVTCEIMKQGQHIDDIEMDRVEKAIDKIRGKAVSLQFVEDIMNNCTRGKFNHWQELYDDIGENFKNIVESGAIDYTVNDSNLGILSFDVVELNETNPMQSKVIVTGL